ncbi:hypothetical protein OIV83_003337 [Microbotryomycetes sp. JL201]|nr:hypothetical protein OIV83_003337 [Microbotryomycetes sp. JL201]
MTSMPPDSTLRRALHRYTYALDLRSRETKRSKDVAALDKWYRTTFTHKVAQTKQLSSDDLTKLVEWKLARGKWRPRLEQLAASNPDSVVQSVTSQAITTLSKPSDESSSPSLTTTLEAIQQLSTLKGIGPATASAISAAVSPDSIPFMSDELMHACFGKQTKIDYTSKAYEKLVKAVNDKIHNKQWTARELEQACWANDVLERNGESNRHQADQRETETEQTVTKTSSSSDTKRPAPTTDETKRSQKRTKK